MINKSLIIMLPLLLRNTFSAEKIIQKNKNILKDNDALVYLKNGFMSDINQRWKSGFYYIEAEPFTGSDEFKEILVELQSSPLLTNRKSYIYNGNFHYIYEFMLDDELLITKRMMENNDLSELPLKDKMKIYSFWNINDNSEFITLFSRQSFTDEEEIQETELDKKAVENKILAKLQEGIKKTSSSFVYDVSFNKYA